MAQQNLFKIEPQEPYKMNQKEFIKKTKSVLEKIYKAYLQGWQSRVLKDGEHPEESVCNRVWCFLGKRRRKRLCSR